MAASTDDLGRPRRATSTCIPHLHAAAEEGKHDLVRQLLAAGADVDAKHEGMMPLHQAAKAGQHKVVQVLLAAGADVDAKTSSGSTALHVAAAYGRHDVVQVLLAAGADVNAKTSSSSTALHVAAAYGRHDVVQQLLTAGADLEAVCAQYSKERKTPLCVAALAGCADAVRVLLAAGANVEGADPEQTPLSVAVISNRPERALEVMQLLLRSGADPRKGWCGRTCLDIAAAAGRAAAVQLLLDEWGKPAVTADALVRAAQSAWRPQVDRRKEAFAVLAKELRKRYPAHLHRKVSG